jgi:putative DNA primase/helicase
MALGGINVSLQEKNGKRRPDNRSGRAELATDLGNARRLVARYRGDIHYVPAWKCWLVWDGRRWVRDQDEEVMRLAKETARHMHTKALKIDDDELRGRAVKRALNVQRRERLRAMPELARSEEGVPVAPNALDADPWLLNCMNGTLNLQTGELLEHQSHRLINKLAPVPYYPGIRLPLWDRFIERVTQGDDELADYLQRLVGYTLVGEGSEEILLLLVGGTATGKSTFIEAIKAVLGDYSVTADFETFLKQHQARGPRNDIARFHGARLVTASEVPPGRQFDEAVVKQLTGGDTITARFLYGEFFEFPPQFTVWLAANHRPSVRDDDDAIWRRLRLVPFEASIPEGERDPEVKRQLRSPQVAGSAILDWAVEGCLKWQRDGLLEPERVRVATRAYQDEMATFAHFVEDECTEGPDLWAASKALLARYGRWCTLNGYRFPLGPKRVAEALRGRGFVPLKRGGERGWQGLALIDAR